MASTSFAPRHPPPQSMVGELADAVQYPFAAAPQPTIPMGMLPAGLAGDHRPLVGPTPHVLPAHLLDQANPQ